MPLKHFSRHAIQVTRSKTSDLCVNSTRRWQRGIEMRGIALHGIEASSVCLLSTWAWLSLAESPGCPVWFPVANYLPPPCLHCLAAGRERHDINQVIYVLNLRSWDPCQSCICVCGPTRHQCYKYWHSGIGRVHDISKPMSKELHPHGLIH